MDEKPTKKPSAPKPPPAPPAEKPSKFKQDSEAEKPSNKLRDKPGGTSGQLDPKLKEKKKPLTQEEKAALKKERAAAKENKQIDKSIRRTEKTGLKLDNAREKLAVQKPVKPPGLGKKLSSAAAFEVKARIHGKIREVERENVGTEAAHKAEMYGERAGGYAVRRVKKRIQTHPARRVRKMEKKDVKANADLRFREMAKEAPELKSNALKRYYHKKRVQKQFRKQANQAAKKAAKKTGKEAATVTGKIGKAAVNFVKKNPKVILILGIAFLLIVLVQSCTGMVLTLFNGLGGGVIGGTSYLAEDVDIDEAELRYTEWETDLLLKAKNAESTHAGYDEYRYNLDTPGHDPYALLAYLTAKYDNFTYAAVQAELQSIFNQQYALTFTPSMEIRTRTETRTGTGTNPDGTTYTYTYTVEVEYEWHILTVTLTAGSFESVISPLLSTQEQQERYAVYMMIKGNRQYVKNPLGFNWLSYVSSGYGYRIHPITGAKDYHTGVDIAVPVGTPITAGSAGTVIESGNKSGYGLAILIDYGNGVQARYAHCSRLNYSVGQTVNAGDVIALSGDTGSSTGPHIHMEVIKDGRFLNPFFFMDGTTNY